MVSELAAQENPDAHMQAAMKNQQCELMGDEQRINRWRQTHAHTAAFARNSGHLHPSLTRTCCSLLKLCRPGAL